MADKTGIDSLVLELERISLEHYAMKSLLREASPRSWKGDVRGFYQGNVRDKSVRAQFDELYAAIQSNPADTIPAEILVACLEKTSLDDPDWTPPEAIVNW
jgi:hypothetical protein